MATPESLGFDRERLARVDALCRSYVDAGRFPFTVLQIARHGEVVHTDRYGMADVEAARPIGDDAIVRIYSMTKPITSVALMMLVEDGTILLDNPVSRFIPEFASLTVWSGPETDPTPAQSRMTVHHVLTHMSGVTAGFLPDPVAPLYRNAGLGDLFTAPDCGLAEACRRIPSLPLVAEPGTKWNYGHSTDIVGRIVEVASGLTLDEFFRQRIFEPLKMTDTGFWCTDAQAERLAACYVRTPRQRMRRITSKNGGKSRPEFLSGAGGLVSTLSDYQRFVDMLRRGGELGGQRILAPRTIDLMARNHLPGGRSLGEDAVYLEATPTGTGFGLGFANVLDPAEMHTMCSPGEFYWGGAASTVFWVDPMEDLTVVFLTQLMPSGSYPIRNQLRNAVYSALVDPAQPRPR